jgi:tetratricopeptide (TPR) repeat protein
VSSALTPPDQPDDLLVAYQEALRRGHQALMAGKPRDAVAEYTRAAELADDRALPHLSLGRALLALGRPAQALAAFGRARERAPADPAALRGVADALSRLGRRGEAARAAAELDRLAAESAAAEAAAEAALPPAEALTVAAERAWHARRADAAVDGWLAAARVHAADGHLDAALDVCQRALLADPAEPRVQLELCRLYLARGWHGLAAERMLLLGRLLELEPLAGVNAELAELARSAAADDARLAALADRLASPPPA